MGFTDRVDAGRQLAAAARHLQAEDVVVLGLPRGGVPVAAEVARALGAPLDVIVVRKLGVPFQPELALGAVGEGDALVLNEDILRASHVSAVELAELERRGRDEVRRRVRLLRGDRASSPLTGRTVLLVDDGIATGATAGAACRVVRARGASRVVLAAPVCAPDAATRLRGEVDELICLERPDRFLGVGQFYTDFGQVPDEEVARLLRRAPHGEPASSSRTRDGAAHDVQVLIPIGALRLAGRLVVPDGAPGVIVFAHGSGSGRHSPRNRHVAEVLQRAGFATLLFDLLVGGEETRRSAVFDVGLLADRLVAATEWVRRRTECAHLPVGYLGSSTGAAAALDAATRTDVAAIVSRGGRPDLVGPRLAEVRAPTLLVVGGDDRPVLELNRRAQALLRCENRLVIVPGATHLFEEPGTLELAAGHARAWFVDHLGPGAEQAPTLQPASAVGLRGDEG